jgi:hypothetical protein
VPDAPEKEAEEVKKALPSLVTALLLLSTASAANAVPIVGLDWLPFSNTLGLSWNQVNPTLQPGGSREGWRYATQAEIESLYTAVHPGWNGGFGVGYGAGWYYENEGIVDAVGSLLGYTTDSGTGFRMIDAIAWPAWGAKSVSNYRLINSARYTPTNMDCVVWPGEAISVDSTTAYGRPVASYLVLIPEPATGALLAVGGLALVRRRE